MKRKHCKGDPEFCTALVDDKNAEIAKLRRDNKRLRELLRYWRSRCNGHGLVVVTDAELDEAIKGDAPPRKRARKVSR